MSIFRTLLAAFTAISLGSCAPSERLPVPDNAGALSLVPLPKNLELSGGVLELPSDLEISVGSSELLPLAGIFSADLNQLFSVSSFVEEKSNSSHITFELDPVLNHEAYRIKVTDKIQVVGGSYQALNYGAVTLTQALVGQDGGLLVPRLELLDEPDASYRGLMIDLARRWHSVESIKQVIELCRFYKIKFLQLHLTDNESFTFPSTQYPQLATPDRYYSLEELRDLERYASARGVTLIPELDVPGHSEAAIAAMPDLFGLPTWRDNKQLLNMASMDASEAFSTILTEMAEVFESSPYIHIGADEARFGTAEQDPDIVAFMEANAHASIKEVYRDFLVRMHEAVRRTGKRTIVWEGFEVEGAVEIPTDILVMAWETKYQLPQDLITSGYDVVNVSWQPLYVVGNRRWSPEEIYAWTPRRWQNWWRRAPSFTPIELEASSSIIGGQMASWEQHQVMEIPSLRSRLPAFAERVWAPDREGKFEEFEQRFFGADARLQLLLRPAKIEADGLIDPNYDGPLFDREFTFDHKLTLSASAFNVGESVYYSIVPLELAGRNDDTRTIGARPDEWRDIAEPIQITETSSVWFEVRNESGETVGWPWRTDYIYAPLSLNEDGLLQDQEISDPGARPNTFEQELSVSILNSFEGGVVRYTTDGSRPSENSNVYDQALVLSQTTHVIAQLFTDAGEPIGEPANQKYVKVEVLDETWATNKTVQTWVNDNDLAASILVDGLVDRQNHWTAHSYPSERSWFSVDLQDTAILQGVTLYCDWESEKAYTYTLAVSEDGQHWHDIIDARDNMLPATRQGYAHTIDDIPARFVKVTMHGETEDDLSRLIELVVY